jgi:hypothetical protein
MSNNATLHPEQGIRKDNATQRGRILNLLISARGEWVPLPAILDLKFKQFGARILEPEGPYAD